MNANIFSLLIILMFLVLFIAAFVGLIVLAVRTTGVARMLACVGLACMALLVAVLPVLLLLMPTATVVSHTQENRLTAPHPAARDTAHAAAVAVPTPIDTSFTGASPPPSDGSPSPNRWQPAADLLPDATADLYPSRRAAENAVANAVERAFGVDDFYTEVLSAQTREPAPGVTQPLRLYHPDGHERDADYRGLADALRRRGVVTRAAGPQVQNHTHQHGLEVQLTPVTAENLIGTLTARDDHLGTDARPFAFTARFVEKPWLTNLAAQREIHGQPDLLVGIGPELESTEAGAINAALRAVALQLAPRLADARPHGTYHPSIRHVMLDSVVRRLRQIDALDDRFVQRLERPYGTVYRAAVLVDATPQFITKLYGDNQHAWTDLPPEQQLARSPQTPPAAHADALAEQPTTRHGPASIVTRTRFGTVLPRLAGLGVLVALTLLIYYALDRWTRGYRPTTVTTTAVALVLGGAALLGVLFMG